MKERSVPCTLPLSIRLLRALRARLGSSFQTVSYAQEGEDLILRRLFEGQPSGFYVDVGAHHPRRFSNTYLFYKAGWSGINIDATPGSMRAFRRLRPRDINLELAVGEDGAPQTFYIFDDPALNTFNPDHARDYQAHGYQVVARRQIATRALHTILREYLPPGRAIDFLSVDVEGQDLAVLRSSDWRAYRPRYLLAETLHVGLDRIAADPVAHFLQQQGYALFAKTPNTAFFRALEQVTRS